MSIPSGNNSKTDIKNITLAANAKVKVINLKSKKNILVKLQFLIKNKQKYSFVSPIKYIKKRSRNASILNYFKLSNMLLPILGGSKLKLAAIDAPMSAK